ncbi:MAG: isoprenylcysteine carboxylmethyltransferase family protein [Candidatus Lokiarchaeota archaeon]
MDSKRRPGLEREAPNTHLILILTPIIFVIFWVLDSFVFQWTTVLNNLVPSIIRIILFIAFIIVALYLIYTSHNTLFQNDEPADKLITSGILNHIRNPMYLGILLIYVALICLSMSLISIGVLVAIFFLYNWMVNFEEEKLEGLFGEDFIKYKENVGKWFPKS